MTLFLSVSVNSSLNKLTISSSPSSNRFLNSKDVPKISANLFHLPVSPSVFPPSVLAITPNFQQLLVSKSPSSRAFLYCLKFRFLLTYNHFTVCIIITKIVFCIQNDTSCLWYASTPALQSVLNFSFNQWHFKAQQE